MFRLPAILLPLALVAASPPVEDAPPGPAFFGALRAADLRVATIAFRLTTANAALCRDLQGKAGLLVHSLDQYEPDARPAAAKAFGLRTPVAVEAVVPGSPAERAGVIAGDGVLAIGKTTLDASLPGDGAGAPATMATRSRAEALLAAVGPEQSLALQILSASGKRVVTLAPQPGCRSRAELMLGGGWEADADGETIRIAARYLERFDNAQVAVIMAHELAHNILRHRARLDAAGVSRGILAEVGRNGRLFRQTEDEADRLSVYLLYNAGYEPGSAAAFWQGPGARIDGGLFRARTHRSAGARAKRIAAEAASIPIGAPRPLIPAMLALRDAAL